MIADLCFRQWRNTIGELALKLGCVHELISG